MTLQIYIDDQIADREAFGSLGHVHPFPGRSVGPGDLVSADALIVRSVTRVDESLIEGTPVRFVGSVTTGVDHIETSYLASHGITMATAAGFNARPVAEYVLAAILLIARDRDVAPNELTLGVVGVGRIGSLVCRWAEVLGMRVLRNDPPLQSAGAAEAWTSIDELLASSDIVTLHVPFTRDGEHATREMANEIWLGKLSGGATLINTSRGGIVDETALKNRVKSGELSGPVIDTWTGEPEVDRELVERCRIATPHIAGHSIEAKRRGSRMIMQSLAMWSRNDTPAHREGDHAEFSQHVLAGRSSVHLPRDVAGAALACDLGQMDQLFRKALSDHRGATGFDAVRRACGRRHEYSHAFDGIP